MKEEIVLGVDIGATGIKSALVDLTKGELISERHKIKTPEGKKPEDIFRVVLEMIDHFNWDNKALGIGLPCVVKDKHTLTASNVHESWINFPVFEYLKKQTKAPFIIINDADAAGIAEVTYGSGVDVPGTLIVLTLGTGIGSSFFLNGELLANTELGHIIYKNKKAEKVVSNSERLKRELSWEAYGNELGEYLAYINALFHPELIILGGGISKKIHKYETYFPKQLKVKAASQFNNSGIIGAALSYKVFTK